MKRLFLLLLFLPPVAGPAEAQRTRPGTDHGDSLRGVVSREFELYAPTDEEIRGANDDIRIAIAQFKRYMGEHPRKMAFVLFRSAADAARYDYRRFTRSETPVVSWVVGPKPRDVSGLRPPGEGNPDPVSHQAGHRFMIAYVEHMQPLLRAAGLAPAETAAVRENDVSPGSVVQHPDHPAVPDWLEEAIAALCERPASQSARLDLMRANLDRRIPIQELLAMSRPADSGRAKGAGAAKGGGAAAGRAAIFSAEALSLARFIAERELNDRFIGTIVEGVLRGRTVGDVLNTSQNVLSKPDALEKQWLEWMQKTAQAP